MLHGEESGDEDEQWEYDEKEAELEMLRRELERERKKEKRRKEQVITLAASSRGVKRQNGNHCSIKNIFQNVRLKMTTDSYVVCPK